MLISNTPLSAWIENNFKRIHWVQIYVDKGCLKQIVLYQNVYEVCNNHKKIWKPKISTNTS